MILPKQLALPVGDGNHATDGAVRPLEGGSKILRRFGGVAVKNLGDVRSFFLGFVQFADDHDTTEAVRETVGKNAAGLHHLWQGEVS